MAVSINLNKDYDFVFVFKRKKPLKDNILTTNEKNHIRMLSVLELIRVHQFEYVMNHDFTEKFKYNEETLEATYLIRIVKKKGDQIDDESQSNNKPN